MLSTLGLTANARGGGGGLITYAGLAFPDVAPVIKCPAATKMLTATLKNHVYLLPQRDHVKCTLAAGK